MRKITISYLLILHFLIIAGLVYPERMLQQLLSTGFVSWDVVLKTHYRTMLAYHKSIDGEVPDHAVIFLGDSMVQGLAVDAVAPYSTNYGIGGDTTEGLIKRLPHYDSIKRSSLVIIAIGTNDLMQRGDDEILRNYQKILAFIPASVPVLISLIFPVDEEVSKDRTGFNERINYLNSRLAIFCEEDTRLYCLDISTELLDEENNLSDLYHRGDGLHLSAAGRRLWIEHLKMQHQKIISAENKRS